MDPSVLVLSKGTLPNMKVRAVVVRGFSPTHSSQHLHHLNITWAKGFGSWTNYSEFSRRHPESGLVKKGNPSTYIYTDRWYSWEIPATRFQFRIKVSYDLPRFYISCRTGSLAAFCFMFLFISICYQVIPNVQWWLFKNFVYVSDRYIAIFVFYDIHLVFYCKYDICYICFICSTYLVFHNPTHSMASTHVPNSSGSCGHGCAWNSWTPKYGAICGP